MTAHRPHPIAGPWPHDVRPGATAPLRLIDRIPTDDSTIYADPDDAILYDDCPRCAQQAANPAHCDLDRLGRLWSRMVEVERDPSGIAAYRTATEAAGCRILYPIALLLDRTHPALDVWRWPLHLRAGGVTAALDGTVELTGSARLTAARPDPVYITVSGGVADVADPSDAGNVVIVDLDTLDPDYAARLVADFRTPASIRDAARTRAAAAKENRR